MGSTFKKRSDVLRLSPSRARISRSETFSFPKICTVFKGSTGFPSSPSPSFNINKTKREQISGISMALIIFLIRRVVFPYSLIIVLYSTPFLHSALYNCGSSIYLEEFQPVLNLSGDWSLHSSRRVARFPSMEAGR